MSDLLCRCTDPSRVYHSKFELPMQQNDLIPFITSYCSSERSISVVIRNFAMLLFPLRSPLLKLNEGPSAIYLFFMTPAFCLACPRNLGGIPLKRFAVRSQHFSGRVYPVDEVSPSFDARRAASETRALYRADSTVNNPASMLVLFDLCCD